MEEGYTESATESDIERCIAIWTKRKLAQSSLNRNYDNTISWLVAQIREASKGVEILDNKIKVIENNDIAAMKREIYQHYQELDEFMKMEAACGFDCLRVKKGWTLRKFYDLVLRVLLALKRLGINVDIQDQKFVYLKSAYMIYGDKGYQGSTRKWITNSNFSLQRTKDTYEFLVSRSHVDPDFSHTYAGASDSDKRAKISCVERLEKLGDTVIIGDAEQSTATEKAREESVNYNVRKVNRLTCTHPACTRNGRKPTHTNEECYIRHPDQCPDEVKEIYDNIRDKFRNNKKTYNKQNNSRKFLKHPDKKGKNLGEHLQKAYLTLVKKDKGNHDGETNFSEDPKMVVALAM